MDTAQGKGPETNSLSKDDPRSDDREGKLLSTLNESLHELSQPMTVLLCALEYGESVGSLVEMKQMIEISQKACERLRDVSLIMRAAVSEAIEERAGMGEQRRLPTEDWQAIGRGSQVSKQ